MNYFPQKYFKTEKDGVIKVNTALETSGTVGNKTLATAVAGKKHRVIGWIAQTANAAIGSYSFTDGSGGANITAPMTAPVNTNGVKDIIEIKPEGCCETSVNIALAVTTVTQPVNLTVFYITYTP